MAWIGFERGPKSQACGAVNSSGSPSTAESMCCGCNVVRLTVGQARHRPCTEADKQMDTDTGRGNCIFI